MILPKANQNAIVFPCEKKRLRGESIISSLKFIVVLAQCFSLLPVSKYHFTWFSPKIIYSLFTILGTFFMSFTCIFHGALFGFTVGNIVSIVFFGGASLTVMLFLKLAKNWSKLIDIWTRVDKRMETFYGYPKNLTRRLKLLTFIIMILATVEHQCSLIFNIMVVNYNYNGNSTMPFDYYYKQKFAHVFKHINYSVYLALLVQVIILLSTFIWTYCDLFIVILSTALAARFKQITKRLLAFEVVRQLYQFQGILWIEIRKDYDLLCRLCNVLNEQLSYIVMLSYVLNLFFLLVQLYNRIMSDTVENVYYTFSFLFLILRTTTVSLFAARINDESKEPIAILNSVPSSVYNVEIQRLLLQMSFDGAALTGCNLFKITRGLILNIAGAIVTYELVLIQFCTANDN